jgi:release factor glutamine methyltransferase
MSSFAAPDARRARIIAELRAAGCVFAEDEADLLIAAEAGPADLAAMVARRVEGEPLEYILGWVDFAGVRVSIEPGVFVPRRRTEFLVHEAVSRLPPGRIIAVDLCCGSGAIGLALASAALGPIELHATDIDPVAVGCARRNLAPIGGQVHEGDLFAGLPAPLCGRVNILVANVPYVPTPAMALLPPEARLHEPRAALDGGPDGLNVFRRVVAGTPDWLAPGGHLLVEVGEEQASPAVAALAEAGLTARVARRKEYAATVVIGTRLTR